MPIQLMKRYSPEVCQQRPECVFVFGDNMQHYGTAGQACIRYELNALGLPTKWEPSSKATGYFSDGKDFRVGCRAIEAIDETLFAIFMALKKGKTVILPEDGMGTGLAALPTNAPELFAYIKFRLESMVAYFNYPGPVAEVVDVIQSWGR